MLVVILEEKEGGRDGEEGREMERKGYGEGDGKKGDGEDGREREGG